VTEPTDIRWEPTLDRRTRCKTWGVDPDHGWPETDLIDGRYHSEEERRVVEGRFNCRGDYVLAPARPAAWPRDVLVPPRAVLGLRDAPIGTEESTQCGRTYPGVTFCLGVLVNRPDPSLGGCYCGATHAPCSYCLSWAPECPDCGHREEGA
jgi:hypothetical protein